MSQTETQSEKRKGILGLGRIEAARDPGGSSGLGANGGHRCNCAEHGAGWVSKYPMVLRSLIVKKREEERWNLEKI